MMLILVWIYLFVDLFIFVETHNEFWGMLMDLLVK